jgi:hypothetical protein
MEETSGNLRQGSHTCVHLGGACVHSPWGLVMEEVSGTFIKDPTLVYIRVQLVCILRGGGSWKKYREPSSRIRHLCTYRCSLRASSVGAGKKYREPSSRPKWCGGGTNPCDVGLDLSGSWQQGHSATYNAPSRI